MQLTPARCVQAGLLLAPEISITFRRAANFAQPHLVLRNFLLTPQSTSGISRTIAMAPLLHQHLLPTVAPLPAHPAALQPPPQTASAFPPLPHS